MSTSAKPWSDSSRPASVSLLDFRSESVSVAASKGPTDIRSREMTTGIPIASKIPRDSSGDSVCIKSLQIFEGAVSRVAFQSS